MRLASIDLDVAIKRGLCGHSDRSVTRQDGVAYISCICERNIVGDCSSERENQPRPQPGEHVNVVSFQTDQPYYQGSLIRSIIVD